MPALLETLTELADAIAHEAPPPAQIKASYRQYAATTALDIYRNNYQGNLHDALAGAYPVVKQLVGDEFFRYMTRQFIAQYPSRSGNLHHYGKELSAFITDFPPAIELAYLADVAALEWACHVAYFASDEPSLALTDLAAIPPEHYASVVLRVHTACQFVRSRYPIAAIWHAHQPDAPCDFHIDLDSGACNALVTRIDDQVIVNELSDAERDWLQLIQTGAPLGETTADTLENHPAFDLQTTLLNLIAQHALTGFKLLIRPDEVRSP